MNAALDTCVAYRYAIWAITDFCQFFFSIFNSNCYCCMHPFCKRLQEGQKVRVVFDQYHSPPIPIYRPISVPWNVHISIFKLESTLIKRPSAYLPRAPYLILINVLGGRRVARKKNPIVLLYMGDWLLKYLSDVHLSFFIQIRTKDDLLANENGSFITFASSLLQKMDHKSFSFTP